MRKSKIIEIEGRGEITVKELSPGGIYKAYQAEDKTAELLALLSDAVSVDMQEFSGWYASEIEQVVDALLEVNKAFFGIARKLKVDGLMTEMAAAVKESLPMLFAEQFGQVMDGYGNTAGSSS